MKWIDRHLLKLTRQYVNDPVLIECMQILFLFANEAGLKGTKLKDLKLRLPDAADPLNISSDFCCLEEVTEEEYDKRITVAKYNIAKQIMDALRED